MEYVALFKVIEQGGWIAIVALLGFLIYRQDKRLEKIEAKLDFLKEDMVSRDDHYRDVSGWREELKALDAKQEQRFLMLVNSLKDTAIVNAMKEAFKDAVKDIVSELTKSRGGQK